jgi:hypothetical protein
MENKEKFYYIKLINTRNGERGFVGENPKGEVVISDQFFQATKMFPTYQEAQKYMRENKLERGGVTAHIRDNDDLIREAGMPNSGMGNIKRADKDLYVVVNSVGQRCFFDSEKGYYFKDGEVGACAWFSEEEVHEFIIKKNFPFETKPLKLENKKK